MALSYNTSSPRVPGWPLHLGVPLPPWNSKDKKCCLYKAAYIAAPVRVLGDIIAKTTPYAWLPLDAPTRTRKFSWFTGDVFFWRPVSLSRLLCAFSMRRSTTKSGTRKDYLSCLRSSVRSTFKCLIKDTPLWHGVMSTTIKNPEDQDGREKRTLSNQPQLMGISPTALLGRWVLQPIKDMASLGTDLEMHTNWQGCIKEPAAKDFVARKARTITMSKAQGTHWNRIMWKER